MKEHLETLYVKRMQKDYSLSLKLQIVKEIESGKVGITECRKKYAIQSRSTIVPRWFERHASICNNK